MREIEIIPSINVETFAEIQEKIRMVEPYAEGPDNGGIKWVHIDVADGTFTDITLWHNPEDLFALQTPLFVEVHLMIADIDERVQEWLRPIVRRIIFHREASHNPDSIIHVCRSSDIQVGIAIRPDSPIDIILPHISKVDLVQMLAVAPGRSGQSFQLDTLQKITALHNACPSCPIEVDGGVNNATIHSIVGAGASLLVAGAAIFKTPDMRRAIEELRSASVIDVQS